MNYITIKAQRFMKIKIPEPFRCNGNNKTFFNKLTQFILYQYDTYCKELDLFTKKKAPFFIGFNGSVASGKSFFAEQFYDHLKNNCKLKTGIISTDNFIMPNKNLEKKKIMHRKGFPESYDVEALMSTLQSLKNHKSVKIPLYDQSISDISSKKHMIPSGLDIIIIEGINILQVGAIVKGKRKGLLISDYLDYSIYIDARERYLKDWFYRRLVKKKSKWKKARIKKNLTRKNRKEFRKWAMDIWRSVNKVNLDNYILPFKERADLILFKAHNHSIKEMAIRI